MRFTFVAFFTLLAVLTGCSSDDKPPTPSPTPSITSEPSETVASPEPGEPCGEYCSGKEVYITGCDKGTPQTVGDVAEITKRDDGILGTLELRKADPAECTNIYWARFTPKADSTPWMISILVEGREPEDQSSFDGDPSVDGYTEGVYAEPGTNIEYCIGDGTEKTSCLTYQAGT